MIGIYKITNKKNGKIYVGQSIHCGKRFDEHSHGGQLIDEVIQIEGIENFTFEVLKEVEKEELNYWEDYYILKFESFFPNGYNKRWNCNKETRTAIAKELSIETKIEEQDVNIKDDQNKKTNEEFSLVGNAFKIYCGLFFISVQRGKEHFILKKKNSKARISKQINVSQKTLNKYIDIFKDEGIILEDESKYYIKNLQEITSFLTYDDFEQLDFKELYILWKIRSDNSFRIKEFYLKEFYWQGEKNQLNSPTYHELRKNLNNLQDKGLITITYSEGNTLIISANQEQE